MLMKKPLRTVSQIERIEFAAVRINQSLISRSRRDVLLCDAHPLLCLAALVSDGYTGPVKTPRLTCRTRWNFNQTAYEADPS